MAKKDEFGLTANWRKFADFVMSDPERNGTKAYQAAYPKSSAAAARSSAPGLLAKPSVAAYIGMRDEKNHKKAGITQEKVLNAVGGVAFQDVRLLYNEVGELLPVHKLPDEAAAFIAGVDIQTTRDKDGVEEIVKKYKANDRIQALTLLMKNLGMLTDRHAEPAKAGPVIINFVDAVPPKAD